MGNHFLTKSCFSLFIGFLWVASFAQADQHLAKDVEDLRNSLPIQDPARGTLTLRLADILFDEANRLSGNPMISVEEAKQVRAMRSKALALYQESLKGTSFHPPAKGQLAIKIQFQMARLMNELGRQADAESVWIFLAEQQEMSALRREAALQLAEYYDSKNQAAAWQKADRYYQLAIDLCAGGDVCSYAYYRKAWSLRDQGRLENGIETIQKALFDSKGQPREEAVRDYVTFLAERKTDGRNEILAVESLVERLSRPALFEQLSDSFFSNGNRQAGTLVLAHINRKEPKLSRQIRLLEEYYGLRKMEEFSTLLDQVLVEAKSPEATPPAATTETAEGTTVADTDVLDAKSKAILRRLGVQFEGERKTRVEFTPYFQKIVELYLKLDPKSPDSFKLMQSWLLAEGNAGRKMDQIRVWSAGAPWGLTDAQVVELRKDRLALAGKAKLPEIVAEEAGFLTTVPSEASRHEEFQYLKAFALYEQEKFDECAAMVGAWVKLSPDTSDWALRALLLQIDVLVKQKKLDALAQLLAGWVDKPEYATASAKSKDSKRWQAAASFMSKLLDETRFEVAAQAGESPVALDQFADFCFKDKFIPKSCDNARVLSVKLHKQPVLIRILTKQGRESELMNEYEASGMFSESAALFEKSWAKGEPPSTQDLLKAALLYELADDSENQERVLKKLSDRLAKEKTLGDLEPLVFQTYTDAGMIDSVALKLPWKAQTRLEFLDRFVAEGRGTPAMEKEIAASPVWTGPTWSRLVLNQLKALDVAHRKIGFYGATGKRKFKQRLEKLKVLDAAMEKSFTGADLSTRVQMAALLKRSYADLATEILAAPTPKEIPPEALAELQAALQQMAQPFAEKAQGYEKIAREQLAQISVIAERAPLEALLLPETTVDTILSPVATVKAEAPASAESTAVASATAGVSEMNLSTALSELQSEPNSRAALQKIQDFYEKSGRNRLASYFKGRILDLNNRQPSGGSQQ